MKDNDYSILIDSEEFHKRVLDCIGSEEIDKFFNNTVFADDTNYKFSMIHGMCIAAMLTSDCSQICAKREDEQIAQDEKNKLATEIIEVFEKLLDEKGIEIPCDDEEEQRNRHYDENCAKLYGMEYYNLLSTIQNLL